VKILYQVSTKLLGLDCFNYSVEEVDFKASIIQQMTTHSNINQCFLTSIHALFLNIISRYHISK